MKKIISKILIRRGFERLRKSLIATNGENWSSEKTMEFLFSKPAELIRPWQFVEEMRQLAAAVEKKKPKTLVEIGTANGGTLCMASRLADTKAFIVSIDLPEGPYGGGYPDWKRKYYESFKRKEQELHLIRDNSHTTETLERLKKLLNGRKVDYLFIDGDHSYAGVKQDFDMYSTLLADDGMVVFHDIVVHKDETTNVYKLWNELKAMYTHAEYVKDWNQKCFGIGVLYPGTIHS